MTRFGFLALVLIPWLALVPWGVPAVIVLANAVALLAALHGLGGAVALATRTSPSPALTATWGLAIGIAVSGLLAAAHLATRDALRVLLLVGLALHTFIALRASVRPPTPGPDERLRWAPILALAVLGIVAVLGLAGDPSLRAFDDETNHRAQVARLLATGSLDDGVGLPRHGQLGGQLAGESLWASLDRVDHLPAFDGGICFVLALALSLGRLGLRSRSSAHWGLLLVMMASAATFGPTGDPSARWSAIALMLGLFLTIEDGESESRAIPISLLAGALATLRHEMIPVAVVALVGTWWPRRSVREGLVLAGIALAGVVPYVVARSVAGGVTSSFSAGALVQHLVLFLAIAVPIAAVLGAILERPYRTVALASVAGLAGVLSQLAGDLPYATRFLWPIAIALVLYVALAGGRRTVTSTIGFVAALVACFVIVQARDSSGRARWSRRWSAAITGVAALDAVPVDGGAAAHYAGLLGRAPSGRRVVAWVKQPEWLPWSRGDIHDLRTPEIALLRAQASSLEPLLDAIGADYLLLEPDLSDDALAAIAREHAVVAEHAGIVLVDLRVRR